MPINLVVSGTPYAYPTPGDEPGWGSGATGWSEAVTEALANLIGPNDILLTSFNIANNQASFVDVTGLDFNSALVRSADIYYSVYRVSSTNTSGKAETGSIKLVYDNNIGWYISQGPFTAAPLANDASSGVLFDVTPAGQIQYKSSDIGSLSYTGILKFAAKTQPQ